MIIEDTGASTRSQMGIYPNFFVSKKEKEKKTFIKETLDYFSSNAVSQVHRNIKTFGRNYKFFKGIVDSQDFYEASQNPETNGFMMDIVDNDESSLPEYVKQYSILAQPINTMIGELSEMPDNTFLKAFDDESRSEELQYKTQLVESYTVAKVFDRMSMFASQKGVDLENPEMLEQVQSLTEDYLEDQLTGYTSLAEKWGNRMLEDLKVNLNIKELSEESFSDLLKCGRMRLHVYEDNSKMGFSAESLNPVNVVDHKSINKKYIKDAHAVTIVDVMEISEIIEKFKLTKNEVDHLRKNLEFAHGKVNENKSQLLSQRSGINSIQYNTFNPGLEEQRIYEQYLLGGEDMSSYFNYHGITSKMGESFLVIQTYILGKEKVGELTYLDDEGTVLSMMVDDTYTTGTHPQEVNLTWGYVNRWYRGLRIGSDVYQLEPLKIADTCPVVGIDYDNRNSEVKGLLDLMKDFQILYSLCINQLWELLQKEIGVTHEFNWRQIPVNKDSDYEDALDEWLAQARELGFIFKDDSPENMKAPTSNTNVSRVLDLSRGAEMQSRINLALAIKEECHQMVGFNRQRLGGVSATETATGTNLALSSSFSQTKPWFQTQEYVMNQFLQLILDVAQYTESQNEVSTVSYVSNEGEHAFIQINGTDLKMRDLRLYISSRNEDVRALNSMKDLALPMLQNGTDMYTVSKVMMTKSIRSIQDAFKLDKKRREEQLAAQQQELEAQRQHEAQIEQAKLQQEQVKAENNQNFQAREKQLDRLSRERVALLHASSRDNTLLEDRDNSGIADSLEASSMQREVDEAQREYEIEDNKIRNQYAQEQNNLAIQKSRDKNTKELRERELDIKDQELQLKKEDLKIKGKQVDQQLEVAKFYDKGKKENK